MSSGPVDHAKHPSDPSGPPRSIWLRIVRLTTSLVILWCLWLIYPLASIRICAARVAGFYEPEVDPGTAQIKEYAYRRAVDPDKIRAWEEQLSSQPIPRLLALLPSRDPVGVWVVSRAIEGQLRLGKVVGWPGRREPVPPLDADAAELILQVLDQDLPPPAAASLVSLLKLVPPDLPQYQGMLLKATEHREPLAREFGIRVFDSMDMDSDETFELVLRLAEDSDPRVRATLGSFLVSMMSRAGTKILPAKYQPVLFTAMEDEAKDVRLAALGGIEFLDLGSEQVSELVVSLLNDVDGNVRRRVYDALFAQMNGGRVTQLPPAIVQAMFENRVVKLPWPAATVQATPVNAATPPSPYVFDYFFSLLAARVIPAERQWQLIESALTSPENESGHVSRNMLNALFLPTEPKEHYDMTTLLDVAAWRQFRERYCPFALEAKPRLIAWASEAIKSDDEATVLSGVNLLAAAAPEQPDRLTPALWHPQSKVRYRALQSLVPSEHQLPRLVELLRDQDSELCGYAAHALSKYKGPLSAEQIDCIVSAFRQDPSQSTRKSIFKLLEDRRPDGLDLRQLIIDSLNSESSQAREWAVQTLRTRAEDATELCSILMDGMRAGRLDGNAAVLVIEAGRPIESLDDARLMIQLLFSTTTSPDLSSPQNRLRYLRQLMKLCPSELPSSDYLDVLVECLGAVDSVATNAETRKATAELLSEMANDPSAALPKLGELLKHVRWETRLGAVFALEAWGPRAKSAAGMLIERLGDPEIRVRMAAADALGAIGPDAGPQAAAALAKMAKQDAFPGGQIHAVNALEKMGPHIQAHLGTLEELSKRSDFMVRNAAAKVLSRQKAQK